MIPYSDEQYEYIKFMNDLSTKLCEIQNGFNKLSDNNKIRVRDDLVKICGLDGVMGLMTYLNQHGPRQ